MIRGIAVVTDSASYLPDEIRERHDVSVVPLTVTIAGRTYREGVDIDPETFYMLLEGAASVTTSQPSPGSILEAYEAAAAKGARAIVSAHIASSLSGTVQSAKVAAAMSRVPVHVVDTRQASFAEGLVVWELLEALENGLHAECAQQAADDAATRSGSTFLVKGLELMERGGRLSAGGPSGLGPIPILAMTDGAVKVVGHAGNLDEAVALMTGHVRDAAARARGALRVGVGHGAAEEIACALRREIKALPNVAEVIDYVVGPSIGAHTGAGNVGAVFIDRPSP